MVNSFFLSDRRVEAGVFVAYLERWYARLTGSTLTPPSLPALSFFCLAKNSIKSILVCVRLSWGCAVVRCSLNGVSLVSERSSHCIATLYSSADYARATSCLVFLLFFANLWLLQNQTVNTFPAPHSPSSISLASWIWSAYPQ